MPKINNHKTFHTKNHTIDLQSQMKHRNQHHFRHCPQKYDSNNKFITSIPQQNFSQDETNSSQKAKSLSLLEAFINDSEKIIDVIKKQSKKLEDLMIAYLSLLKVEEAINLNNILRQIDEQRHKHYNEYINELKRIYDNFLREMSTKNYSRALQLIDQLRKIMPNILKIKLLKIQVLMKNGDLFGAKKLINKLPKDNHPHYFYLQAQNQLYLGHLQQSKKILNHGKKFQSQTNKLCSQLLQIIQRCKIIKSEGIELIKKQNYHGAIQKFSQILAIDPFNKKLSCIMFSLRSSAYFKLQEFAKALDDINTLLSIQPLSIKALFQRARINLERGQFAAALMDYQKISEIDPNIDLSDKYFELKQRQRQSKKKDYYKILRIQKTASQSQIKKAYKILALQFHPDKNINKAQSEQIEASKKFREITQAYGVLIDPHKKQLYDNGSMKYDGDQGLNQQYEYYEEDGQNEQVSLPESQFMFESNNPFNFGFVFDFSSSFFNMNLGSYFQQNSMEQQSSDSNIIYYQDIGPQKRQYSRSRQKSYHKKNIGKQKNKYRQTHRKQGERKQSRNLNSRSKSKFNKFKNSKHN